MKSLNFIDAISSCKEREVQRWFFTSLIAIMVTVSILLFIQVKQIRLYHSFCGSCACCAKSDEEHAQLTKHLEELQVQEKELQDKLSEFSKQKSIVQQTITRLNCLAKLCGTECHLQSYSATDRDIQMTIAAPSSDSISQLLASFIASNAFNNLVLVSMQPHDKGYLFTIKNHC